ncbi:hypothetical protein Holit_01714 [Hollandina sp. SP2]
MEGSGRLRKWILGSPREAIKPYRFPTKGNRPMRMPSVISAILDPKKWRRCHEGQPLKKERPENHLEPLVCLLPSKRIYRTVFSLFSVFSPRTLEIFFLNLLNIVRIAYIDEFRLVHIHRRLCRNISSLAPRVSRDMLLMLNRDSILSYRGCTFLGMLKP